jgi:hypothetical protein
MVKTDALSPLFFDFALEYVIRKVQENQVGLKLNGTHQLLLYANSAGMPVPFYSYHQSLTIAHAVPSLFIGWETGTPSYVSTK